MAKSDISVKLGLNSKEFDDNIKRSRNQIRKFKTDSQSTSSQIAASMKDMAKGAGAFGLALVGVNGVSAAFDTLLSSSQAFGDSWNNTLTGCKTVFNDFVQHLANADLSGFAKNVANAYTAGVASAKAYDQLGNTKMSYSVASARKLDQLSDIDTKLSKETDPTKRQELITERQTLIAELRMFANTLNKDVIDALSKSVNASLGGVLSGDMSKVFDSEMFIKSSEIDLDRDNRDTAKAEAEKFYKEFNKNINPLLKNVKELDDKIYEQKKSMSISSTQLQRTTLAEYESEREDNIKERDKYINNLSQEERQHLLNYITLFRFTDEQLQSVYSEMQSVFNSNRVINRIEKREPKAEGTTTTQTTKTTDKQTVKNNKVKVDITLESDEAELDYSFLSNMLSQRESLAKERYSNGASQSLLNSESFKSLETNQLSIPDEPKKWDLSSNIEQTLQLGNAISSMTNSLNIGGNSWVSYGANIISAVAAAIPAILALTSTKEAEAQANTKVAVTGAAASVASIPVVGWIMAGVAVASVIAAMASMPKFATGGIVSGGSVSGDKIPALLNSGEMVLNTRQQANLFNQLDRQSVNNQSVGGVVEFKIKGDYLAGILNKNSKKSNRI